MIRKSATVPGLNLLSSAILIALLAGTSIVYAQQTQSQQPPAQAPQADQQSSSSQEASAEETTKPTKVKEYKNWTFNVGGGASLTNGTTANFVRGGGGIVAAGFARNTSKYFGLRLDFQFDNLPLRNSALELAQANSATSHAYSFTLDPIINIPASKNWGGYILFGPAF